MSLIVKYRCRQVIDIRVWKYIDLSKGSSILFNNSQKTVLDIILYAKWLDLQNGDNFHS